MSELEANEDWEEWDGRSPFWMHCVAGSLAGVVEHTAVYPLDTVRTHIQVCAGCSVYNHPNAVPRAHASNTAARTAATSSSLQHSSRLLRGAASSAAVSSTHHHHNNNLPTGVWQTIRFLMSEPAILEAPPSQAQAASAAATTAVARNTTTTSTPSLASVASRFWRGVPTILVGCIPAHACYFSSYETVKYLCTESGQSEITPLGSSLAGAAAVLSHDAIMTPLDTMKQRMQLGHYTNIQQGLEHVIQQEGWRALYRSFPVTLVSNVPYGMVMVSINEACKQALSQHDDEKHHHHYSQQQQQWQTIVLSSSIAGFTASAVTTPLDRIKTALQTQALKPACLLNQQQQQRGGRYNNMNMMITPLQRHHHRRRHHYANCPKHASMQQAFQTIVRTEGYRGLFRGLVPRVLSHTPAVAISWTTYEWAKQTLLKHYG